MCNDNSPQSFANQKRAVIVAPAGYGKTELIAKSVAFSDGRQLVLTHTHAGVDSLRKRMKEKYNIPSTKYYVETIHSFALRFAGSYPKTTGLNIQKPQKEEDYSQIITSATRLFDTKLGKDILKYSFAGIFVDEYQDCEIKQHLLVRNLAKILPCRIVGDPLQAIYDFGNNQIVDWNNDVFQYFEQLPDLTIPYRWKYTNKKLGERLRELREQLLSEQQIEFKSTIDYSYINIIKCLYNNSNETSIFVISNPNPSSRYYPHFLARSMNNIYHTIEPLTSHDLCNYAKKIELTNGDDRLKNVINFSKSCLTKISNSCKKVLSLNKNLDDVEIKLKEHFRNIKNNNNLNYVYDLFSFFEIAFIPTYKRKQLWREMKEGLHEVVFGHVDSLEDAVWHIRNQFRFYKKRIPERCISRTVLLKGLECDHVIIIRPELFDMKNLYVALTRASSKVTIISKFKTWSNY